MISIFFFLFFFFFFLTNVARARAPAELTRLLKSRPNRRQTTRSLAVGVPGHCRHLSARLRTSRAAGSRFPPKGETTPIDGNAIRDWTPHMISRPVPAVLFVCRNREDLAWISAFKLDCSYLQSLFPLVPPTSQNRSSLSPFRPVTAFLLPSEEVSAFFASLEFFFFFVVFFLRIGGTRLYTRVRTSHGIR